MSINEELHTDIDNFKLACNYYNLDFRNELLYRYYVEYPDYPNWILEHSELRDFHLEGDFDFDNYIPLIYRTGCGIFMYMSDELEDYYEDELEGENE